MQKRSRFLPCNGLEKLQVVFIQYENAVATANATPFASDGTGNTYCMKTVAISTCSPVTKTPEMAKRKACFENTEVNNFSFIAGLKNAKQ